jgi:hypothetical protein
MEDLSKKEGDAAKPDTVVDNRLRARWQNNINEYVTVVWFGEVDAVWGKGSKGITVGGTDYSVGNGGKQGADGVNVETKNAFLDVKFPGTPVSTRIGIQAFGDETLRGVVMNDDAAGITFSMKTEKISATAGWVKLLENNNKLEDDSDAYGVRVGITPVPGLVLSPELYYFDNKGTYSMLGETFSDTAVIFAGLGASYKVSNFDLSGAFLFQSGETDVVGADNNIDISAWAATVKAAADFSGFKVGARAFFFPESSDDEDITFFTPPNNNNGAFEFYDEGLGIFLADAFYMNTAAGRLALTDAAYAGYGLMGLAVNCAYTLPSMKALTIKGAVGMFSAMDEEPDLVAEREDTYLGTELALSVGYKVAEKAEFILRGNYAMLGDFYDNTTTDDDGDPTKPDDQYKLALTVNVPY